MSNEATAPMQPRLVVLSGPLKGEKFILSDEFFIGRKGATLALDERAVSRSHCSIRKEGTRYVIKDLESHNGTFVNGERIREHLLEHGDRIVVGDSQLLVLLSDEEIPPVSADVQFIDHGIDSTDTFSLRAEDAEYLQPDKVLAESFGDERVRQDLSVLLRIGTTVNVSMGLGSLESRLLDLILGVIPADAGAVLLRHADGAMESLFAQGFTDPQSIQISRTVVDRVLHERTAILSNDIQSAIADAPSLIRSEARALLCVPLLVRNRAVGVIYLIVTERQGQFDQRHLQLLIAISAMAALPLETAREVEWLQSENRRLRADIDAQYQMVGSSAAVKDVYSFISRVAAADSTVLVGGESGTGKELVARAIHRLSARAKMPFIVVNCAALTETLIESELFGHEKGAFTGAVSQSKGKFEIAERGTVFLDEIGELPLPTQSKLLRVLQERELNRVGNPRPIKINVRIIAATNRNLEEEVRQGRFRTDLFYRLNVVSITLPSLRNRREDIKLLAEYFLQKFNIKCNRRVDRISFEAMACLMDYDWPGNIRELENAIERAVVLGLSDVIVPEDLPDALLDGASMDGVKQTTQFHDSIREAKRQLILRALEQCAGNHAEAAKALGLNRTYLHRLIRLLKI